MGFAWYGEKSARSLARSIREHGSNPAVRTAPPAAGARRGRADPIPGLTFRATGAESPRRRIRMGL
jgi:hypothetical protein